MGADGAWSKVRPLVTDLKPTYTGTCFVETHLSGKDPKHKDSAEAIGSGTLMAVAPGKGILAHRNADGSLHIYVALNCPEDWVASIDFRDARAGWSQIAEQFNGWAASLTALITDSEIEPVLRPIYALPVGIRWYRTPGVTLVGDAAHLMSPFAGEGANLAMYDGSQLAKFLVNNSDDIETALAAYESELFERSQKFARQTAENLKKFSTTARRKAPWICSTCISNEQIRLTLPINALVVILKSVHPKLIAVPQRQPNAGATVVRIASNTRAL